MLTEQVPSIFNFLKNKKVLICEVKTPGMYLDIDIIGQILGYQSSYSDKLKRKKVLNKDEINKTVLLTIVSKFSDSMKKWLKENNIIIKRIEEGFYFYKILIYFM